jgi:hypothetical protein
MKYLHNGFYAVVADATPGNYKFPIVEVEVNEKFPNLLEIIFYRVSNELEKKGLIVLHKDESPIEFGVDTRNDKMSLYIFVEVPYSIRDIFVRPLIEISNNLSFEQKKEFKMLIGEMLRIGEFKKTDEEFKTLQEIIKSYGPE